MKRHSAKIIESYCKKSVLFFWEGNLNLPCMWCEIFSCLSVRYLQESCPIQSLGRAICVRKLCLNRVVATLRSCILFTPFFLLQEMQRNILSRKASAISSIKTSSCITFIMTLLCCHCYSMKLGMGEQEWASGLAEAAYRPLQRCAAMRCERATGDLC